jgi:2Fe-2S ferredoxin
MYTVQFSFDEPGLEPVVFEHVVAGQSLLELALINNIELHHNCGGVCACTTCQVYIVRGMGHIDEITIKEKNFVARALNPAPASRLSCQCLLLNGSGEVEVRIPDQSMNHQAKR